MLDELKFRYRSLRLGLRLMLLATLSCVPGALAYFDEAPLLEEELQAVKAKEVVARQELATATAQVKNLPAMEEKLAYTSDQLKKAEKLLPSVVLVDQVLEHIGKSAKDADVYVKYFAPVGEKTIAGEYPYDEVRFKVTVGGKFPTLAKWMDVVAGYDTRAYLKSWELLRSGEKVGDRRHLTEAEQTFEGSPDSVGQGLLAKLSRREIALKDREDYQLDLKTEIVYYRVASAVPPKGDAGKPGAKGASPGAPGAPGALPQQAGTTVPPPPGAPKGGPS
ncbi:MAG: type 4a pilus biogenesis protein PilO [Proteobacteria bacterium]|nr:type 4a pilus biogenesis protein PilO [Pseudomonadota bacterium]